MGDLQANTACLLFIVLMTQFSQSHNWINIYWIQKTGQQKEYKKWLKNRKHYEIEFKTRVVIEYTEFYNKERPPQSIQGKTPKMVYRGQYIAKLVSYTNKKSKSSITTA
jgi:hypothetical protein